MSLTAEEIYGFSESLLKGNFDNPQPTPDFHMELWDLCCSAHKNVAIAAPRGHAKSTCITHSYVLANVLFKEASYVLVVSDTEEQAVLFLADIKMELIENERLIAAFGISRLTKDTETDIIVLFEDGTRFRIVAKGSEQKIRGRKWRGKRPDLIVGDDLENDEIVMNEERRAKFRRWMNNALIPCLSDDGRIRIVGTILHFDSFLERCMPSLEDKDHTFYDGLRYWSDREDPVWHSVRYRGHDEEFTNLLWESKWPKERYLKERRRYEEDGNLEGYNQEYLNYPIDEGTAYFRRGDFLPWQEQHREEYLEYYVGGDLAISQKDSRAYTVFVVAGMSRRGRLVVVDVRRGRWDALEIIDELFNIQSRYKPEAFFIEKENIHRTLGPILDKEMMQRQKFLNIIPDLVPILDKTQRARPLQARTRAGGVEYDMEADWYISLVTEMMQFPRGKFVDQVDALSWIGLGLDNIHDPYTEHDIAEFEYDDEYNLHDQYEGRSATTGY
jgi:predicted phage terminase large subunit-like protein